MDFLVFSYKYQKTIYISSFPNNTTNNYPHGISNVSQIIDAKAIMFVNGGIRLFSGRNDTIEADKTNVTIVCNSNYSSYSGYATLQYIKTT